MNFKEIIKADDDRAKYKVYCSHCNHSIVFPPNSKKNKKVCTYCGYYIYKNDKEKFKEKLKGKIQDGSKRS